MAIQVRRGLEADFDADKMLPGEWAVSTDTRYVRMCFSPGIVLRMATYESFEADVSMMQDILADCKDIQTAIKRIQNEVNAKASFVVEYARASEESAKNAKRSEERAKMYAENASAVSGIEIASKDRAGIIKGGDNHIAEDGTLELTRTTTSRTLTDSYAGGLKINEIVGASEQSENPTPEYPQPIKSVGDVGSLTIKISNADDTESNTITIPLEQPLRECDKIVKKDGLYGVLRGTKVVPFGGTWRVRTEFPPSDGSICYSSVDFIVDNMKREENMYMACTHLLFGGGVNGGADIKTFGKKGSFYKISIYVSSGGTTTYVCSDAPTLADFMEEMEGSIFEYELATPVFEPFDTDTQIALYSLMSYKRINHIHVSGNIQPTVEIEHGTSPVGAYTLEALNIANRNNAKIIALNALTSNIANELVEREV